MRTIERRITIPGPPDAVYGALRDLLTRGDTLPGVAVASVDGAASAPTTAWSLDDGAFSWTQASALDDGARTVRFEAVDGDFDALDGRWAVSVAPRGAELALALRFALAMPVEGDVIETRIAEALGAAVETVLARIAEGSRS
jgi:ribosome-associated toxin RatA of RatAB toxin-antitoxin module